MVIIEEASSSDPSTHPWKYDVFLSFKGEDTSYNFEGTRYDYKGTRYNFTGHLYSALCQKGIITFMDDQLIRGEDISLALLQAIELSKISIVVFSEGYAFSKWCLDELVKILDCKKSKQQIVLPVFYKVDPSDIRNHRRSFGEGLASLECKFTDNMKKVQEWKSALKNAGTLSGWPISEKCSEAGVIQDIVQHISRELVNSTILDVAKYPVGIKPRVQEIHKLLGVEGRDVHMVGIWGAGGIGKTTIANAVYNSIAHGFDGSCFLENVRENSKGAGGIVELQKKLLCEILRGTREVTNVARGITMIKKRLNNKSVLVVLDDVSDIKQLDSLAGECRWFGKGSKIIITTRDKQLLIRHSVDLIHRVQELAQDEALELFSRNAFKSNRPLVGYEELTEKVLRYAQGLPLALTVLGSSLWSGNVEKWQAALDGSESHEIKDVLQISYDLLDEALKAAFLDMACFFKGENREHVVQTLGACGHKHANVVINVLIEKALISIEYSRDHIWMHDLVQEMGRDIVYRQSPDDPGERSRLWFHEDVSRVLTENIGTRKIISIKVELPKDSDEICFSATTFSNMQNLRMFIYRAGRYSGVAKNLPNSLRVVDWPNCRLNFLPSILPGELALLDMPGSRITILGNGLQKLKSLTSINLRACQYLRKVSDLSGVPKLQSLDLTGCQNLVEVNPSVGFLKELIFLSLQDCPRLKTIPTEVHWKSMTQLRLGYCPRLKNFIEIVHEMESIRDLDLHGSSIKELHSCIGYCTSLQSLILVGNPIRQLPSTIGFLTSLVLLDASETLVEELPLTIGNLSSLLDLMLSETPLKLLPPTIGSLTSLRRLDASETLVEELPSSIGDLTSLRELIMFKTHIKELPSSIGNLTSLIQLKLSTTLIKELPSSIKYLTSLVRLDVSKTLIIELPSSIEYLTSLEELDASETLIEELPSSIMNLCLYHLTLKGCANLTNVPQSVYGGMQHLGKLDLSCCPKLITFPSRATALVSPSAESIPLKLPTNSTNVHDDCSLLLFPKLGRLRFEECKLSISDLLTNLDCVTTLLTLNLSGSSFDSLPACISNFRRLESLDLGGCKKLRDVSELPANIQGINLDDCVSLERFSTLSNILQQNDSTPARLRIIKLCNCHKLVDNLGRNMVSKMAKALLNQLVSDGLAWYVDDWNIILPSLPGIEVPKWFDSSELDTSVLPGRDESDICELLIKIPRTLKGERIGLVVCVAFEITQNFSGGSCGCTATFRINNELCDGRSESYFDSKGTMLSAHDHVCVYLSCIGFKVVDPVARVIFHKSSSGGPRLLLKSFGVHLEDMQNTDHARYRLSNASNSNFDDEEAAAVASNDLGRQTNICRAMLAFLMCFGITLLLIFVMHKVQLPSLAS